MVATKPLVVLTLLLGTHAAAFVDDLQITEHVRYSELIIDATIRERRSASVVLDVVEVLKGTAVARLTVELGSDFRCDMSNAVPSSGRGLFYLQRESGQWRITQFGRGFIERSADAKDGHLLGGVIVPRAWLVDGDRSTVRWSEVMSEVRRLVADRRVFPDAGWLIEQVDCHRCALGPIVARFGDGGVFDWGRAEHGQSSGVSWLRDRMLAAQASQRSSMGILVTASSWPRSEELVDEGTLMVLWSQGRVTSVVAERIDAGLEPSCWNTQVSTFACEAVTPVDGGWLRCERPLPLSVCTPAATVRTIEAADVSRVRCRGRRCSVDGEGWALGDLDSSGSCRATERGMWCVRSDGGVPTSEVVAPGSG